METKNLIMTIVGVAISVIIVAACLMPVLSDAVKTEDTFMNEGLFRMTYTDDDFSFEWDYDDPTTYEINGDSITFVNSTNRDVSIVMSDMFFIRSDKNSVSVYFNGDGVGNVIANSTNKTLTMSREGSTVSVTNGDVSKTITDGSRIYYYSVDGDYVMKDSTKSVYLNSDSLIFCRGYSTLTGPVYTAVLLTGNIEDGINVTPINTNVTVSDVVINDTEVTSHIDLYSFTSASMVMTANTTDNNITYDQVLVPYLITAERAVHFSSEQIAVFSAIPLLIIVAILLMAVSIINKGRE